MSDSSYSFNYIRSIQSESGCIRSYIQFTKSDRVNKLAKQVSQQNRPDKTSFKNLFATT